MGKGAVEQWAMESYSVAKQVAYGGLPTRSPDDMFHLDAAYNAKAEAAVATQLSKAGVRLAWVLNRSLSH